MEGSELTSQDGSSSGGGGGDGSGSGGGSVTPPMLPASGTSSLLHLNIFNSGGSKGDNTPRLGSLGRPPSGAVTPSGKPSKKWKAVLDDKAKLKSRISAFFTLIEGGNEVELRTSFREHEPDVMRLLSDYWIATLDKLSKSKEAMERYEKCSASFYTATKEGQEWQRCHRFLDRILWLAKGTFALPSSITTLEECLVTCLAEGNHPRWRSDGLQSLLWWLSFEVSSRTFQSPIHAVTDPADGASSRPVGPAEALFRRVLNRKHLLAPSLLTTASHLISDPLSAPILDPQGAPFMPASSALSPRYLTLQALQDFLYDLTWHEGYNRRTVESIFDLFLHHYLLPPIHAAAHAATGEQVDTPPASTPFVRDVYALLLPYWLLWMVRDSATLDMLAKAFPFIAFCSRSDVFETYYGAMLEAHTEAKCLAAAAATTTATTAMGSSPSLVHAAGQPLGKHSFGSTGSIPEASNGGGGGSSSCASGSSSGTFSTAAPNNPSNILPVVPLPMIPQAAFIIEDRIHQDAHLVGLFLQLLRQAVQAIAFSSWSLLMGGSGGGTSLSTLDPFSYSLLATLLPSATSAVTKPASCFDILLHAIEAWLLKPPHRRADFLSLPFPIDLRKDPRRDSADGQDGIEAYIRYFLNVLDWIMVPPSSQPPRPASAVSPSGLFQLPSQMVMPELGLSFYWKLVTQAHFPLSPSLWEHIMDKMLSFVKLYMAVEGQEEVLLAPSSPIARPMSAMLTNTLLTTLLAFSLSTLSQPPKNDHHPGGEPDLVRKAWLKTRPVLAACANGWPESTLAWRRLLCFLTRALVPEPAKSTTHPERRPSHGAGAAASSVGHHALASDAIPFRALMEDDHRSTTRHVRLRDYLASLSKSLPMLKASLSFGSPDGEGDEGVSDRTKWYAVLGLTDLTEQPDVTGLQAAFQTALPAPAQCMLWQCALYALGDVTLIEAPEGRLTVLETLHDVQALLLEASPASLPSATCMTYMASYIPWLIRFGLQAHPPASATASAESSALAAVHRGLALDTLAHALPLLFTQQEAALLPSDLFAALLDTVALLCQPQLDASASDATILPWLIPLLSHVLKLPMQTWPSSITLFPALYACAASLLLDHVTVYAALPLYMRRKLLNALFCLYIGLDQSPLGEAVGLVEGQAHVLTDKAQIKHLLDRVWNVEVEAKVPVSDRDQMLMQWLSLQTNLTLLALSHPTVQDADPKDGLAGLAPLMAFIDVLEVRLLKDLEATKDAPPLFGPALHDSAIACLASILFTLPPLTPSPSPSPDEDTADASDQCSVSSLSSLGGLSSRDTATEIGYFLLAYYDLLVVQLQHRHRPTDWIQPAIRFVDAWADWLLFLSPAQRNGMDSTDALNGAESDDDSFSITKKTTDVMHESFEALANLYTFCKSQVSRSDAACAHFAALHHHLSASYTAPSGTGSSTATSSNDAWLGLIERIYYALVKVQYWQPFGGGPQGLYADPARVGLTGSVLTEPALAPPAAGLPATPARPCDATTEEQEAVLYVKLGQDTLLALYQSLGVDPPDTFRVIVRHLSGKYAWRVHIPDLALSEASTPKSDVKSMSGPEDLESSGVLPGLDERIRSRMFKQRDETEQPPADESEHGQASSFPMAPFHEPIRAFLAMHNWLLPSFYASGSTPLAAHDAASAATTAVPVFLPKTAALVRDLKVLDKKYARDVYKVACLYVAKGQREERDILANHHGSPAYHRFVASLGWIIDVQEHPGYIGGLERKIVTPSGEGAAPAAAALLPSASVSGTASNGMSKSRSNSYTPGMPLATDPSTDPSAVMPPSGSTATYYCTTHAELIFHDVTQLPFDPKDQKQVRKKRHIGNDHIHVVFQEDPFDPPYKPTTIRGDFGNIVLVVSPLPSHSQPHDRGLLYRVRVWTRGDRLSGTSVFGPLTDGLLIPEPALAACIRATLYRASQAILDTLPTPVPYQHPFHYRAQDLFALLAKHAYTQPPASAPLATTSVSSLAPASTGAAVSATNVLEDYLLSCTLLK